MGIMALTTSISGLAFADMASKNEAASVEAAGESTAAAGTGNGGGAVAPSLKIAGNTIQNVYVYTQKKHNNGKGLGVHMANDVSDLIFLISGMTSNGIGYKYKIAIDAYSNASPVVSQNYAEFNTCLGSFQLGNVVGPEDTMIKDAGAIVAGTGAFDGGYYKVFNLSALAMRGNDNVGDTGSATKFVYYTPSIYDLQFGVSYTPDTTHLGDAGADTNTIKGNPGVPGQRTLYPPVRSGRLNFIGTNVWAFGAAFQKQLGNWELNLTGDYLYGEADLASREPEYAKLALRHIRAFQLGTVIAYKFQSGRLLQFGAGYLKNGKSAMFKQAVDDATIYGSDATDGFNNLYEGDAGRACNFGLAYTAGIYKFSGAYQHTHRKTDAANRAKNQVYSLAADVNPVTGLKFFGELNRILSNSNNNAVDLVQRNVGADNVQKIPNVRNRGTVFIMGTKISF